MQTCMPTPGNDPILQMSTGGQKYYDVQVTASNGVKYLPAV